MRDIKNILIIGGILFLLFTTRDNSAGRRKTANADRRAHSSANQVTLRAAPGKTEVMMLEGVGEKSNGGVTFFRDGTVCTKLNGPNWVAIQGIGMRAYRLTCNGTTGDMNVKWVDDE